MYTRAALERWVATPPSPAEQAERLEQLRALHCGLTIGVARLTEPALPGVDTPDDLRRAEAHWHALPGVSHMTTGPNATKYIFVTGGVVSSLGKGIAAASLGACSSSAGSA